VRPDRLRREHPVGVLEAARGIRALCKGHPEGVARTRGDQPAVRRIAFDIPSWAGSVVTR
jgi:hypothetical protein